MKKTTTIKNGTLWLGTSGIALPGSKQTFPSGYHDKSRLSYYSSIFNTLEINSSFYKVPQSKTFLRWATEVPEGFRFSVKLWKEITHIKNLEFKIKDIDFFMQNVVVPEKYKACLLIQLPGKITSDYLHQVILLLTEIKKRNHVTRWQLCIEFRHASWYRDDIFSILNKLDVDVVWHDMPKSRYSAPHRSSGLIYMRFHGRAGDYKGSYPQVYLTDIAAQVMSWLSAGTDVYIYFNNTMGDAFQNALFLKNAIKGQPG